MIQSFGDQGTADIYNGQNTPAARRTLPRHLWGNARRKMEAINNARDLRDLEHPGLDLRPMQGAWAGWYRVKINDQYRIVFQWSEGNAYGVTITDYHA